MIVHRIIRNKQFAVEIEKLLALVTEWKKKGGSLSDSYRFFFKWGHWVTAVLKVWVLTAMHVRHLHNGSAPRAPPHKKKKHVNDFEIAHKTCSILVRGAILKDWEMGCAKVTHLRFTDSRFCFFYSKTSHFEAHLIVSSRVVESKVLRMAIQFEYFFLIDLRQNGECIGPNVRDFRRFLFGMSPDVPAFKVRVFISDFKSELE